MSREARGVPFWSPQEIAAAIPGTIRHVEENGVLAYPTETVYGFGGAIDSTSVDRLIAIKHRPPGKPFLLLISGSEMIARLGLHLSNAASVLAARFWPGPLTLVLAGGERRVPGRLRGPEGGIAVRWTSHPGLQRLIGALGDPLTSTSANRPGSPPAMTAAEVLAQWDTEIASNRIRLLDGGTLKPSPASTVVDCTSRLPRVIRPGAITAAALRESVPDLIGTISMRLLFVCTGNTCRSALAEAIATRIAAERGIHDVSAASAGTSAWDGAPASDGALLVGLERKLDLNGHRSRPLTREIVVESDLILAMGPHHAERAEALGGDTKTHLLTDYAERRTDGRGIVDPFGGGLELYRATADELERTIGLVFDRLASERASGAS